MANGAVHAGALHRIGLERVADLQTAERVGARVEANARANAVLHVLSARCVAKVLWTVVVLVVIGVDDVQAFRTRAVEGGGDEAMNRLADQAAFIVDRHDVIAERMIAGR